MMRELINWSEELAGFRETNYEEIRSKFQICNGELCSLINGRNYGIGKLELVSLKKLLERVPIRFSGM